MPAPNGLIVTRDTSFFKTYCYLIASLEIFQVARSGHAEASAAKRLRSSQLRRSHLDVFRQTVEVVVKLPRNNLEVMAGVSPSLGTKSPLLERKRNSED